MTSGKMGKQFVGAAKVFYTVVNRCCRLAAISMIRHSIAIAHQCITQGSKNNRDDIKIYIIFLSHHSNWLRYMYKDISLVFPLLWLFRNTHQGTHKCFHCFKKTLSCQQITTLSFLVSIRDRFVFLLLLLYLWTL